MSRSAEALNLELVTSILQLSRSMYIVFIENIWAIPALRTLQIT